MVCGGLLTTTKKWRGLKDLVGAAVENGSIAIERIQKETARRPFTILEQIPVTSATARGVHAVHDATVSGVHAMVRLVNRVVVQALDVALDVAERGSSDEPQRDQPDRAVKPRSTEL